jgi:exopolysaccharide biosynthesis polyprenyl glycosylphosphotransferase
MSGGIGNEAQATYPEAAPSVGTQPQTASVAELDAKRAGREAGAVELGVVPAQPAERTSSSQTRSRGLLENLARESRFRRALLMADAVAIVAAFVVLAGFSAKALQFTWVSVCGLLTLLLAAKMLGLYDRDDVLMHKTTLDEAPRLFQVATLGALSAWLAGGFVIQAAILSRREALMLWVALILLLVISRATARALMLRALPAERCLFIGDHGAAKTIRAKLAGHRAVNAELVGHIDLENVGSWSVNGFSPQRLAEVRDLASQLNVHRAIVAPTSADGGEMLDLVRTLKAVGVRVSVLPRLLEVVGSSVEFDDLHGVTLMGVRRFEMSRSSAFVKRAFDLIGASLGLLAVAPLFAVVAVAIKLDSRGPVFFRQLRVGRHGQHFELLKFRTMVDGADAMKESLRERNEAQAGLFKIADDPRVTRVGKLLRKSALDELPQLLNIIRGEMSLVGPRPLVLDEDRCVEGWYRRRLELMPGMTGPWQILGPSRVPLTEMGAMDYLYVANWSLWGDIKIMLRTVPHVVGRRGL